MLSAFESWLSQHVPGPRLTSDAQLANQTSAWWLWKFVAAGRKRVTSDLSISLNKMSIESVGGLRFGLFQPEAPITFETEVEAGW